VRPERRSPASRAMFVHVGDQHHGVRRFGWVVAEAARRQVVVQHQAGAEPEALAGAVAIGRPAAVFFQFTDKLWGSDACAAAASFERAVAAVEDAVTVVTLHDCPPAGPIGLRDRMRRHAYRRVASAVDVALVCSHHEAARLRAAGGVDPVVVPHFVEHRPARPTRGVPAGRRRVVVLGFLYPGKGHHDVLQAVGRLGPGVEVIALGGPAPGHHDLVQDLQRAARRTGTGLSITGWVPERDLEGWLGRIEVPVVANVDPSASGSLATWIAAGRRPIVRAGAYADEWDEVAPETTWRWAGDDPTELAELVSGLLAEPDRTWHGGVPCALRPASIAARHLGAAGLTGAVDDRLRTARS
jgi:glycosyltransferase involved in cell wall biosynthesis